MTKPNQEPDGDATSSPSNSNTVFIDTNLDTHLAMIVSHSDTVLHLKKKIMTEHPKCFPNCGKIIIDALKVKRKGFFYHLSDSMLVKNAFEGAKKCWFLSVDASSIEQTNENQKPNKPEAKNQLASICHTKTTSGDVSNHQANGSSNKILYLCYPDNYCNEVQKNQDTEVKNVAADSGFNLGSDYTREKQKQQSEKQVVLETCVEYKEGDSQVGVNDNLCNDPQESSLRSESGVNKKRKSKKSKTAASNYTVKDTNMDIDEHSSGKRVTEVPKDTEMEHMDACNMGFEANIDHTDDNSEGIDGNNFDKPLEESLRSGAIGSKKCKSKNITEVSVLNFPVKIDNIDIDVHSSGRTDKELLVDVEMVNIDAAKEDMEVNMLDDNILRLNTVEFLGPSVKTRDDLSKNPVSDAQENTKLEEASKKRKKSKSKKTGDRQEETYNKTPVINAVPESSVPKFQKIMLASDSTENLITEVPEDINLGSAVASSGEKKRKKRKKKSSKEQEVIVELPPSKNPEEERCKEDSGNVVLEVDKKNVEIVTSEMDKTSDAAIVSVPDDQLAIPSAAEGLYLKERDDANAKAQVAAPDLGPESAFKVSKKMKKRHSTKGKELTELGNLREDVALSGDQDGVLDDHEVKINGPDKMKEQRESSHNHGTEVIVPEKSEQPIQSGGDILSKQEVGSANLADTSINMECGKSVSSKRLKKRAKKPVSTKAGVSSAECSANSGGERLSRNEDELLPLIQVNKSQENKEIIMNNLVKDVENNFEVKEKQKKMDSLQHIVTIMSPTETKDSAAKSKKKMKKNQNFAGETYYALPVKEQEDGDEELVSSNERHMETDNACETEKKRKLDKMSSENQFIVDHLEPNKNSGNELGSLTSASDSTQAPSSFSSDTHEGNFVVLSNQHLCNANDQVDNTKRKDDRINFLDYFSPGEGNREAPQVEPVVNSVKKFKRSDIPVEAKKKIEEKSSLGNNRSTIAKSSSKRMGEVVNSSRREKSLLATTASIFWDYSSESSEDSDSIHKATSDNSSSSSDSEGEYESVLDSARNGGANDGRSQKETKTPLPQRLSMDVILRSSSRFKRAKLMAAQSQIEDMESQEVDIVPESQPF